ncbi:MAG: lytic transglycosylase domain-containing protein [Patescibacteria group bacterium]
MKKIAFLLFFIFAFTLFFPKIGIAVCCQQINGSETIACSEDYTSNTECASWSPATNWYPDVPSCDFVNACTALSGEEGPVADSPEYILEVPLGNTTSITGFNEYIKILYRFGIGLIALIALFLIVFNGINWILAGGNDQRIGEAKKGIVGAVIGLVIALSSFVILNTINPKLVSLDEMEIPLIQLQALVKGTIEKCEESYVDQMHNYSSETITTPSGTTIDLDQACVSIARGLDIDPLFLKSIAYVESSFRTNLESECGAYGIVQIQPDTAIGLGFPSGSPESCLTPHVGVCRNSFNKCGDCDTYTDECKAWIAQNPEPWLAMGARYLNNNYNLSYINGDLALTAASYNAGEGAVQRAGGVPNIIETIDYVKKVKDYYERNCASIATQKDLEDAGHSLSPTHY